MTQLYVVDAFTANHLRTWVTQWSGIPAAQHDVVVDRITAYLRTLTPEQADNLLLLGWTLVWTVVQRQQALADTTSTR